MSPDEVQQPNFRSNVCELFRHPKYSLSMLVISYFLFPLSGRCALVIGSAPSTQLPATCTATWTHSPCHQSAGPSRRAPFQSVDLVDAGSKTRRVEGPSSLRHTRHCCRCPPKTSTPCFRSPTLPETSRRSASCSCFGPCLSCIASPPPLCAESSR